jgi:hypothetical protein
MNRGGEDVMKAFWSHKFRYAGLRYKFAVCILTGSIVWINGPFPCGDWNDLKIFKWGLMHMLDPNECVEANAGYSGEDPIHVHSAARVNLHNMRNKQIRKMRDRVRARHETVNNRLKYFKVLSEQFHHDDLGLHSICFYACAVLTQIAFENGHPPFPVNYTDDLDEVLASNTARS